jgi:hypothetical protein
MTERAALNRTATEPADVPSEPPPISNRPPIGSSMDVNSVADKPPEASAPMADPKSMTRPDGRQWMKAEPADRTGPVDRTRSAARRSHRGRGGAAARVRPSNVPHSSQPRDAVARVDTHKPKRAHTICLSVCHIFLGFSSFHLWPHQNQ